MSKANFLHDNPRLHLFEIGLNVFFILHKSLKYKHDLLQYFLYFDKNDFELAQKRILLFQELFSIFRI